MAPASVAFGLCLAATLAARVAAARRGEPFWAPFRRVPAGLPLALFVGLSLLAVPFSTLPARSLVASKGLWTFALLPVAAALLSTRRDVDLLVDVLRGATLVLVVRGAFDYLGGERSLESRLTGGITYMTYAGLLAALVLVLLGRALDGARPRGARLFDAAVGVAGAVGVGLTLTRSAYLGLAVGLAVLFASLRPKLLALLPVLAAGAYLASPASVKERVRSGLDTRDVTMRDRLAMWQAGARMVADRPFFGVGPGRVKALYPVYRVPGWVDPHPGHLHDNVVTVAAETGVPSAFAYLWLVAALLGSAAGSLRRLRMIDDGDGSAASGTVRGCLAAFAALFAAGLFEYNFGDVEILRLTLVLGAVPAAALRSRPS